MTAVPEVQYWWREAPVPGWSGDHPGVRIDGYLLCPLTCRVLVQDDDGISPAQHRCIRRDCLTAWSLMARWVPIATVGALTPLARGLLHPNLDNGGRPVNAG